MPKRHTSSHEPLPSEITPHDVYLDRRRLVAGLGASLLGLGRATASPSAPQLKFTRNARFSTDEPKNSFEDITTYNNFYEFGTSKDDPSRRSGSFHPSPWSVTVAGEAELTGTYTLEDILKPHALEERIYRLRCVEAWSMVIPWVGFPLGDLIRRFKPTSRAKYVAFKTVLRPSEMPGQRFPVLDWPYVEGLRMDEAMHPLTILAVGLYGQVLPNQNGAPLRVVVPWKYGFKSIKSIVEIRFTERLPPTSWNLSAPQEYGFYSNVNPAVDHPRWSQATERRLGGGLFSPRRPTLPFNGYADQVASLYRGMDLQKNF
ncbi:MAG: protein-methionine-sulfoxide reductase catalytic subunit MsrP [Steroidobacteraceae bacterium]